MSGPGDQASASEGRSHGNVRASHADRERVIGTLKAAFVQGMLAKDEFDLRVGQALASRTYAELAVLTADLPAGLTAAQPPRPPGRRASREFRGPAWCSRWPPCFMQPHGRWSSSCLITARASPGREAR